uniref:PDF receptor n=1 Tax=Strongyloides papillosus TaxID=174720 RepID=A0A0N5BYF4_STREA
MMTLLGLAASTAASFQSTSNLGVGNNNYTNNYLDTNSHFDTSNTNLTGNFLSQHTTTVKPFFNHTHYNNFNYQQDIVSIVGLYNNTAGTMEECHRQLLASGFPITNPDPSSGQIWCNATWDTILCWPATPAGQSATMRCPDLKALDTRKYLTKYCHESGRWLGKNGSDWSKLSGWTNFSMCFQDEVAAISRSIGSSIELANDIARYIRYLEFIGLFLSIVSLVLALAIFASFPRLRVFRNMLHIQLMIAILMVSLIRFILYIDLEFTDKLAILVNTGSQGNGNTINTLKYVCESMYILLEYFKSVGFSWSFLEGFYLHNQLVFAMVDRDPKLPRYILAGFGAPIIHTLIWLVIVIRKSDGKVKRCLGNYYLMPEFWILDGVRLAQLIVNTIFVVNVIRVLWKKVQETHNSSEMDRMKKSVRAAFMLIPLLGIPNVMQTIPLTPTENNIFFFGIWTFVASSFYMFQGLVISIIFCFTNKEVQAVLYTHYTRYKLQHTSTYDLRRGSKSQASHYSTKLGNGGNKNNSMINNGGKKLSGDSASNLLLPTARVSFQSNDRSPDNSVHLNNNNENLLRPSSDKVILIPQRSDECHENNNESNIPSFDGKNLINISLDDNGNNKV